MFVTNQSGIGRGYFSWETLHAMHQKLQDALDALGGNIDAFFVCPHLPEAQCSCRKPKPGLFEQALDHFKAQPEQALAIGDSERDCLAAAAAGIRCWSVQTGNSVRLSNVPSYLDLAEAVDALVRT